MQQKVQAEPDSVREAVKAEPLVAPPIVRFKSADELVAAPAIMPAKKKPKGKRKRIKLSLLGSKKKSRTR